MKARSHSIWNISSCCPDTGILGDTKLLTQKHAIQLIDCESIEVFADWDKIGHILINLVSNAMKYSPQGGTIALICDKKLDGSVNVFVKELVWVSAKRIKKDYSSGSIELKTNKVSI